MTELLAAQPDAAPQPAKRYRLAYIVIIGLFASWGLAQWLFNVISPQFAQFSRLNPLQATWTQSLLDLAFCVLAIPAALFHRKFGYKLGVIFAMCSFAFGPSCCIRRSRSTDTRFFSALSF